MKHNPNEPAKSLKQQLHDVPALKIKRQALDAELKTIPVDTCQFREKQIELKALDKDIRKAESANDLTWRQALKNVGLPF